VIQKNNWQTRFGAARRVIDRKLLAEVEKQIGLEGSKMPQDGHSAVPATNPPTDCETAAYARRARLDQTAVEAIAKAFGRPAK
jgi:hypothetical protein